MGFELGIGIRLVGSGVWRWFQLLREAGGGAEGWGGLKGGENGGCAGAYEVEY